MKETFIPSHTGLDAPFENKGDKAGCKGCIYEDVTEIFCEGCYNFDRWISKEEEQWLSIYGPLPWNLET